jgi:two-component system nitrogen regulation response regulator GlnG
VVPIRLPPLRERTEDIPALARHFLASRRSRACR